MQRDGAPLTWVNARAVPAPTTPSSIPIEHLFASALQQQQQQPVVQTTPEDRLAFLLVALIVRWTVRPRAPSRCL